MEKDIIKFSVQGEQLERITPLKTYAANTVHYIEAHFTFNGDAWSGYDTLTAVWFNDFYTKGSEIINGVTIIPAEVLKRSGALKINLCADKCENNILVARMTSRPVIALQQVKTRV